jgi:hypothetical protein
MARLSASVARDFTVPAADNTPSPHGSQREDAILALYLPEWGREASPAAKAAFLPDVPVVAEGNSRGRGATLVDGFRVNPARSAGGDFLSLKAPTRREDGGYPTSVELFKGTRKTLLAALSNARDNYRNRKAFPVVVCHTEGDTLAPRVVGWEIRDFGRMVTDYANAETWELWGGVPRKPLNDKPRGAGGSPASVWATLLRREFHGYDKKGNPKYKYIPDDAGEYVSLTASFSKRSGATFAGGSMQDFAAQVNAATVLR